MLRASLLEVRTVCTASYNPYMVGSLEVRVDLVDAYGQWASQRAQQTCESIQMTSKTPRFKDNFDQRSSNF
jgi:hypothetical protein